jgi:hypothetical protein
MIEKHNIQSCYYSILLLFRIVTFQKTNYEMDYTKKMRRKKRDKK